MAGNLKKLGYLVLLPYGSFYRAGVYRPENRLLRPIFLHASEDRTAIHLGPSKITYGRHKLYSGDKPARSKVAIGDAWT